VRILMAVDLSKTSPGKLQLEEIAKDEDAAFPPTTADSVQRLQRELGVLQEQFKHNILQQEQKDNAQDELLTMQFDLLRSELKTYVRSKDLEDQKSFMLAKLQALETDVKEELRSGMNSLRDELLLEAKLAQERMEKVSSAVASQVKMVDARLQENSQNDAEFEAQIQGRLNKVEVELGVSDGTDVVRIRPAPSAVPSGEGASGDSGSSAAALAAATAAEGAVGRVLQRVEELSAQVDALSGGSSGGGIGEERALPKGKSEKIDRRMNFIEEQVTTVIANEKENSRIVLERFAGVEATLQAVLSRVDEAPKNLAEGVEPAQKQPSVGEPLLPPPAAVPPPVAVPKPVVVVAKASVPNPGSASATKAAVEGLEDRLGALEQWIQERVAREEEEEEEEEERRSAEAAAAAQAAQAAAEAEAEAANAAAIAAAEEENFNADEASQAESRPLSAESFRPRTSAFLPETESGAPGATPTLAPLNLLEDMERLQCIIECMEETMPLKVRQSIAFFKRREGSRGGSRGVRRPGGNKGKSALDAGISTGFEMEAEVMGLREEAEDHAVRVRACEERLGREQANLHRVLRGYEREQGQMKEKLDELWKQLPQLVAILTPLQVQVLGGAPPAEGIEAAFMSASGGAVRAETPVEALKPLSGLIEASMQKFITEARQDLLQSLSTVQGELGTKASSNELTMLRERVERWARRSPGIRASSPPPPLRSKVNLSNVQAQVGTRLGVDDPPASPNCHHQNCKAPTCPCTVAAMSASQSTGRLPSLNKSR